MAAPRLPSLRGSARAISSEVSVLLLLAVTILVAVLVYVLSLAYLT